MPLFNYRCAKCDAEFEMLIFGDEKPTCPQCGSHKADQLLTRPAPPPQLGDPAPACQACGSFGACPGHPG